MCCLGGTLSYGLQFSKFVQLFHVCLILTQYMPRWTKSCLSASNLLSFVADWNRSKSAVSSLGFEPHRTAWEPNHGATYADDGHRRNGPSTRKCTLTNQPETVWITRPALPESLIQLKRVTCWELHRHILFSSHKGRVITYSTYASFHLQWKQHLATVKE